MKVDVILGLQWGDEGKGKIVDYLAPNYDIVARFQGGPNAGHTLKFDSKKYVLHTIPSGIFRKNITNIIGNGVVVDPITLCIELKNLQSAGVDYQDTLIIAKKAHLILPTHRLLDAGSEASKGKEKIGSTLKGIGPTYMDKTGRNGLRVGDLISPNFKKKYTHLKNKHLQLAKIFPSVNFDLEKEEKIWFESIEKIKKLQIVDGEFFINDALSKGKKILAEGAQGSMLDIEYGTYPFVTSSNTITAGVCTGLGIAPQKIGEVIGITKAYCTRVGSGPFPTELNNKMGDLLRKEGEEFGATTGRPRRCGWIDLTQLNYTIMLNGITQLVVTKIDVLNNFKELQIGVSYSIEGKETNNFPYEIIEGTLFPNYKTLKGWQKSLDGITQFNNLPEEAKHYLNLLESKLKTSIKIISTGPERNKLILK